MSFISLHTLPFRSESPLSIISNNIARGGLLPKDFNTSASSYIGIYSGIVFSMCIWRMIIRITHRRNSSSSYSTYLMSYVSIAIDIKYCKCFLQPVKFVFGHPILSHYSTVQMAWFCLGMKDVTMVDYETDASLRLCMFYLKRLTYEII